MENTFEEQQKYEEVILLCNEGLTLDPVNLEFLLNRSHALIKIKKYKDAIRDCDQVISIDSNNALAYYNKGCATASISSEEAISLIAKAINLDGMYKERAKDDPDLEKLRRNPDFRKLFNS